MKKSLTFLLLFTAHLLCAQVRTLTHAPQTYIYKITDKEAESFYRKSRFSFQPEPQHFHTLYDSIDYEVPKNFTDNGHFIFASVVNEEIIFELKSYQSISAEIRNNDRDFRLQVFDRQRNPVTTAKVTLADEPVPYHAKTGTYRLKKQRHGGLLRIETEDETAFYNVHTDTDGKRIVRRWRRFVRTPVGRLINSPYRWGRNVFSYLRRGISRNRWTIYNPQKFIPFYRYFQRRKQQNGYLVLHKPKYNIGDTLKIKAYLTNHRGKPLRKAQRLTIEKNYNQSVFSKTVKPTEKGNFIYEYVLGDSLTLDKNYRVSWGNNISARFRLEDYQLDEVTWDLSSEKEKYDFADKVIFTAEGKDSNGNTVPDGEVKITLIVNRTEQSFDEVTYIPDTLWTHDTFLKTRGSTRIVVPDSIFPAAEMSINVRSEFQNANGESETHSEVITVSKKNKYFKTDLTDGLLSAVYMEQGKVAKTAGEVLTFGKNNRSLPVEKTEFPYRDSLNPNLDYYLFRASGTEEKVWLRDLKPGITVSGTTTPDSVFIDFGNPHAVEVAYLIQTEKRVVTEGKFRAHNYTFSAPSDPDETWFVKTSYLWGGNVKSFDREIRGYKKLLNIDVVQADKVQPGTRAEVVLKVTDYQEKPARAVNLTAAAVNAQFKEDLPVFEPQLTYKAARAPFIFERFSLHAPGKHLRGRPLTAAWYETFALDSIFYYKMRWENGGGFVQSDSITTDTFAKNIAQFTPHLIKNGRAEPLILVYANRKPLYYYGSDDRPRHAFVAPAGYNRLTLRTRDAEYTLDSVFLKKGHKAEVVIDADNYEKSGFAGKFEQSKMPKHFTPFENNLLRGSMFLLHPTQRVGRTFLWQNEENIHFLGLKRRNGYLKIGPFADGRPLHFLAQENFYNTFPFTSGFSYEVSANRERLFEKDAFPNAEQEQEKFPKNLSPLRVGDTAYTPADMDLQRARKRFLLFGNKPFDDRKSNGKLNIDLETFADTSLFFLLTESAADSSRRAFRPLRRAAFDKMPAGDYTLSLFTVNGYFTQKKVRIQSHTTTWLKWENPVFHKDTTGLTETLTGFVKSRPRIPMSKEIFDFQQNKNTGIIGRITDTAGAKISGATVTAFATGIEVATTKTDPAGNYKLLLPPGHYVLEVKTPHRVGTDRLRIFLNAETFNVVDWISGEASDEFWLSEVKVIGFEVPLIQKEITSAAQTLSGRIAGISISDIDNLPRKSVSAISSRTAGVRDADISIRGSRSDGTFYYIDGIRVSGNVIAQADSEIKILQYDAGADNYNKSYGRIIYGTVTDAETGEPILFGDVMVYKNGKLVKGTQTNFSGEYKFDNGLPNGVLDLVFKYVGYTDVKYEGIFGGGRLDAELSAGVTLESVAVVAYSVPSGNGNLNRRLNLPLDAAEEEPLSGVQLRSRFKDYAYWQPNLKTDKNGEARFTINYPDNITSWKTHVIGMDKKQRGATAQGRVKSFKPLSAQLALPRFLTAGDSTEIIGKAINYTDAAYELTTRFTAAEKTLQTAEQQIDEALIESAPVTAPTDADSLLLGYTLRTGDYGDGEVRSIPIFRRGTEETVGDFHLLRGDTTLTLDFDPAYGAVTLRAENDVLGAYLSDLEYLKNYPYGCNEQTASRLTALLLEQEINARLNRPFSDEKEIKKAVARLVKTQNDNGSWGWWSGNTGDLWMTTTVLRALSRAKAAGYPSSALEFGLRWLTGRLPQAEGTQLLSALELLSDVGQNLDYAAHLAKTDSVNVPLSLHLTEVKIRQAQGLHYTLDSLQKYERETLFGGIYWGSEVYDLQRSDLALTQRAYEIYRAENNREKQQKIIQFFLEKRSRHFGRRFGRNTYETAQILALLLPEISGKNDSPADLANTLKFNSTEVERFPFTRRVSSAAPLVIEKTGAGTVFFTAYQKYFNPTPQPAAKVFAVRSEIRQNGKATDQIKQGEKAVLEVTVEVKKAAEYVLLEIPIPAGCSYLNKHRGGRKSREVHREYFKEKTAIFCRDLPQGTYTFRVDLEPRFSGRYTLNPARAEEMYFPVFWGRSGIGEVTVGE